MQSYICTNIQIYENQTYESNIKKEEVLNFDNNICYFESDEKIDEFKVPKPQVLNYNFKGSTFNLKILGNTISKSNKNKNYKSCPWNRWENKKSQRESKQIQ